MKAVLALAVLAVIAVSIDSSAIKVAAPADFDTKDAVKVAVPDVEASADRSAARQNLNVGSINSADRILLDTYVQRYAQPNAIHTEDRVYRGAAQTRIAAVQAFEVGATQYASARIIAGGVGYNNVTVRFTSARGRGYYYQFRVWGR